MLRRADSLSLINFSWNTTDTGVVYSTAVREPHATNFGSLT